MNKKSVGVLLIVLGIALIGGLCWWVMTTKPGTALNPIDQSGSQGIAQADVAPITQETLPKIDCATAMKPLSREIRSPFFTEIRYWSGIRIAAIL